MRHMFAASARSRTGSRSPAPGSRWRHGIPKRPAVSINLGYRDPDAIRIEDCADREDEGVLLVRKAGEMLYRLRHPPAWGGSSGA